MQLRTRLLRSSALRLALVIALLFVPFLAIIFYQHHVDAANTAFTAPAEARGDTFASVSCTSGCTGTAITIPSGRLGFIFISSSSGDIPSVTSAHGTWTLLTSRSGGESSPSTRRASLFTTISGNSSASALTITMPNNVGDGGTVVYAYAASGYTYIRQVRLINYNDPVSEGGDNGTANSPADINLLRTPTGPIITFLQAVGTATSIQPNAGEPYSELCYGAAPGSLQGNGGALPAGSWCMADDVGDNNPSISFTGGSPFHWSLIAAEVANTPTNIFQVEVRGFSEFTGTTAATGVAVTTDAFDVYANSLVIAAVTLNDGGAGDNNDAGPMTISDSTGKSWAEIRVGGQASGNADSRIDARWAAFPTAASGVTVTFTPTGAGQRYAYVVTQIIGADLAAPISESGGSNGTGTASVTLVGIATGNMAFSFAGVEVGASIAAGTGDMEYSEAASGGTNPQRIQAQRCGSNICDIAGLVGNQGVILAFELTVDALQEPPQPTPTPTPTPPPVVAPASDSSSNTNTVRVLIALSVMIVPLLLVARVHLTLAIILATSLLVIISIVAISTL